MSVYFDIDQAVDEKSTDVNILHCMKRAQNKIKIVFWRLLFNTSLLPEWDPLHQAVKWKEQNQRDHSSILEPKNLGQFFHFLPWLSE